MRSRRIPDDLRPNRLSQTLEAMRADGVDILDLTLSNPTRAGFDYPADLLRALSGREALTYAPEPFGLEHARRAVAETYRARGMDVSPEQIALTSSTSEACSLLFKVLCDAETDILVPRPSYPLFEHLARLDGVAVKPYDLEYHGRWSIDVSSLEAAFSAKTRALMLVSPHNPTGSFVTPDEFGRIAALAADRDAAVIVDEVFADYELKPGAAAAGARVLDAPASLTFALGGFSKSIGLPQLKLGWIATAGPAPQVERALADLEFACDAYLSVSTPVQVAAGDLLRRGASVRHQIQSRTRANLTHLLDMVSRQPACRVLTPEAGWSAILQIPAVVSEETLVLSLLCEDRVLVHPGYFFDFEREAFIVVSLLVPEPLFTEGIQRILRHIDYGLTA